VLFCNVGGYIHYRYNVLSCFHLLTYHIILCIALEGVFEPSIHGFVFSRIAKWSVAQLFQGKCYLYITNVYSREVSLFFLQCRHKYSTDHSTSPYSFRVQGGEVVLKLARRSLNLRVAGSILGRYVPRPIGGNRPERFRLCMTTPL